MAASYELTEEQRIALSREELANVLSVGTAGDRSDDLVAAKDAGATAADLVIAGGPPAELRLAEYDPWGHIQVSGTGAPPYSLEAVEVDLPAQQRESR